MINAVLVHDVVESNGKTVRQNNMDLQHTIPMGSLVELCLEDQELNGLRLFVVQHSRDCDGEPLYDLSFEKNVYVEQMQFKEELKTQSLSDKSKYANINAYYGGVFDGKFLRGFSAGSLKVIR